MTFADFKNYYENKHMPLLKSIAGDVFPISHTRHYVNHDEQDPMVAATAGSKGADFDCIATIIFETLDKVDLLLKKSGENREAVEKDEAEFLDRTRTRAHAVEEYVTRV